MAIELDERALLRELGHRLDDPDFRRGIAELAGDAFFLAHFLVSVSQGEGLGEAAVGMIGQNELARRIDGLRQQEEEERGHKESTFWVAAELFPEYFDDGRYRFDEALDGQSYYVAVLEANRARLRHLGRGSRLNLYLTTTFGYEIMVLLLYRAVARAVAVTTLPADLRERVGCVIEAILEEEEGHLGVVGQHRALLAGPRDDLSEDARSMLEALEELEADDYDFAARLAVDQVVMLMSRYADAGARRAEIEAAGRPAGEA